MIEYNICVSAEAWSCGFCGAVVVDREKHTQWHSGAPPGSPTWVDWKVHDGYWEAT